MSFPSAEVMDEPNSALRLRTSSGNSPFTPYLPGKNSAVRFTNQETEGRCDSSN